MANPERNNSSSPNYQGRKREVRDDSFRPFVQIDIELIQLLSNSDFKLYAQIKKRAGSVDGKCWESIEHMAAETNMGVNTIKRSAKSLLSKNLIKKTRRPGATALYSLTPPSQWVFSTDEPAEVVAIDRPNIGQNEPNIGQNGLPNIGQNEPNIGQNGLPNIGQNGLLIRSLYELDQKELDPTHKSGADAHERGGVGAYLCDSKSKKPENPETAASQGQDADLEPLRKAEVNQNPEPETAVQDCPEPSLEPLRKATPYRNSEPSPSSPATAKQNQSQARSGIEETSIPPAGAQNSPQEAAFTPAELPKPISADSSALKAQFSGGADPLGDRFKISGSWRNRKPLLDKAIAAYEQARHSSWGKVPQSPSSVLYADLDKVYRRLVSDGVPDPEQEFLLAIASATLWVSSSEYHTKPGFSNKNLTWLIKSPEQVLTYADKWRSLPQELMVGAAIKITAVANEKQYCNPQGNPCSEIKAKYAWWDISDAALKGETITQADKDWANYYFPKHDIYKGDDELND